jgi:WD40 repeat protein
MALEREAYEMGGIYSHRGPIKCLALSSDDKRLASGGLDSRIIIWDTEKNEPIDTMIGNNSQVNSVTFSPSGNYLASGGADKNIRIWNVIPDGENFGSIVRCIGSDCDGALFEGVTGVDKSAMEFLLAKKAKVSKANSIP